MVPRMRFRRPLAALVASAAILAAPASAPAQTGAGDDQYQDPFSGQNDDSGGGGSQTPAATATPAPAPAPAPSQSTTSPSTTAPATTAPATTAPATAVASGQPELPRTGLDTAPLIVLGTVLLASGVALRVRLRERR
jgi:hypothetical protein